MKTQLKFLILSLSFITSFVFGASNTPNVSISPTSVSILEGTASVDLTVTLSPAPNQKYMDIAYSDQCNVAGSTIRIAKNTSIGTITIPTSGLAAHTSCNIVLTSAIGGPAQNDGNIVVSTATITITAVGDPTANDKSYTTIYNTSLTGNVITDTPADSDPNSHPLTIASNTSPSHGSVNLSGDGSFTYTPTANYSGMDSFGYTITNSNGGLATATVSIEVFPPQADLGILKSGPSAVNSGAPISYGLLVSNSGSTGMTAATDVKVIDALPSGMTFAGVNAPTGWSCNFATGTVTCTIASLPTGYSETITINTTAPYVTGDITNTATISSSTQDNNSANDSSSLVTTITDSSTDLKITKTASPNPVNTASTLVYTLVVENIGSNNATGITVEDSLPLGLQFVSVTSPDWSCSQGQLVSCNYTANGGILAASTSSGDITITVTTPPQAATVLNSATVTSTTPDSDTSNDESNVTVTVNDGTNVGSDVPLTKYLQYNIFGDMRLIGNANVNFSGTDPNANYNDHVNMRYVKSGYDSGNHYNSSSSALTLTDPSYEIIWAGLYWEGHICSSDSNGNGDGAGTGCDWSNSDYNSFNQGNDNDDLGVVKLKTPDRSGYIDITANNLNIIQRSTTNWTYSAFADITHLVGVHETGTYSVADIVLTEGLVGNGGNYGGWSILTIYRDPSNGLHYKNISVFKGFQYISSDGNQVDIDGFVTPLSGDVNASIAFFAADGDPVVGGVARMREGTSSTYSAIGDPVNPIANPTTNLFNSTIAEFGVPINTGITKTYGVDADRVNVSDFMVNDQHDTSFLFDVSTPSGGVDHYSLTMFAFATDLTTPIIDNFTKSAAIIVNGASRPAGPGEAIYPGDELLYTLVFSNTGDEIAELVEIFDDFDFDGLTPALDLDNFDASKIRLYEGADASGTEVTNNSDYDCGYDFGQRRVYCRLDEVAINETFTMQFSVTIKDPMDTNKIDENATNTAYSMYKNPNGDNYVILESNSHGNFGGSSNSFNAGVFVTHGSSTGDSISIDAINRNYDYAYDRNITTKIVNEPFSIKLIHIDKDGQNTGYDAGRGGQPMVVYLSLCSDPDAEELLVDPSLSRFTDGDTDITVENILLTKAHKDDSIRMAYADWGTILSWPSTPQNCVANSNIDGNLKGVPQCLNSPGQGLLLFPPADYPHVADVCYDTNSNNGGTAPCDSEAYDSSGPKSNIQIMPSKYHHSYGCYQCLTDQLENANRCSTDNFAARPDHFELDSNNNSFPDLLRSGQDYNLSLKALDGSYAPTHLTTEYNVTAAQLDFDINKTLYLSTGAVDINDILEGNITFATSNFDMLDGISIASGTTSNYVVGINFNNVAKVGIKITDVNWTKADLDDTPQDCTTSEVTINGNTIAIEGPAFICGETNATFIPHHFTLSNVHLNNHAQKSFTYLSNDLNMSAHVDVTISARNALEGVTSNFRKDSGFYEHAVSVGMLVTDWNASLSPRHPLDNNEIIHDIPTEQLLGFGGTDTNGTHTIPWNETNETQKLMFNYTRHKNEVVNPFLVPGTDVNLTVVSTYTGSATESTAIIQGTELADNNATFTFGRTRSSKYFYDDIQANTVNTPILIDVYCDLWPDSKCNDLEIDTINGKTNHNYWWLSWDHDENDQDGNITLTMGTITTSDGLAGSATVDTDVSVTTEAKDDTINVTYNSGAKPMLVEIDLDETNPTDTNSWLIYNPSSDTTPSPFYKVRFTGQADWAGQGPTGYVVDGNTSIKKNNRLGW